MKILHDKTFLPLPALTFQRKLSIFLTNIFVIFSMTIYHHTPYSGKRMTLAFLFMVIMAVAVWWCIAPANQRQSVEKKVMSQLNRILGRKTPAPKTKEPVPSTFRARRVEKPAPPTVMLTDEPSWALLTDKQRYLEPEQVLTYKDALKQKLRLNKIVDLEAGADGSLYALHATNMRVYVFSDELNPVCNWPLQLGKSSSALGERLQTDRFLENAVALACGKIEIDVVHEDGQVGRWRPDGTFIGKFAAPYSIRHVGIFPNSDLLLVTPGDRFLLHRVSRTGVEKLAYAVRDSAGSPTAKIFDRAMAAILPDGGVVMTYEYPYRLEFYDPAGNPVMSLSLPLSLMLAPPEIERDRQGQIKRVFRQIVAYDLQVGPDSLVYHLVRLRGAEGGNQWDIFSSAGELLQHFYLPYHQRAFCFSHEAVYVLGAYPEYKLEKFRIAKLKNAQQLSPEWMERIQRK